jgi:ferredoxin
VLQIETQLQYLDAHDRLAHDDERRHFVTGRDIMIAIYGYEDASGSYFIRIDTSRCDGCGECARACKCDVLATAVDDCDQCVAIVNEAHRKKLRYSCAARKHSGVERLPRCVSACSLSAISHSWQAIGWQVDRIKSYSACLPMPQPISESSRDAACAHWISRSRPVQNPNGQVYAGQGGSRHASQAPH